MCARPWLFLLLCLLPSLVAARSTAPDAPRFRNIGTDELPSGVITSLAEDRDGFLWLGAAVGLVRHDGYRFRLHLAPAEEPAASTALFVRSLHADSDGELWVGSDFSGLLRYDRDIAALRRVALDTGSGEALSINALAGNASQVLWAGSDGAGLFARHADGRVRRFRAGDSSGLPDDRIGALLLDRSGTLWVGTWSGIARLDPGSTRFAAEPVDSVPQRITALFEDADTRLWVGTRGGRLFRREPDGRVESLPPDSVASSAGVYAFLEADATSVWIGRSDGIEIRERASGALRQMLRHDPDNAAGLASNEVRALLRDRGGQIWVAGYGIGLQRHDPHNAAFVLLDRSSAAGRLLVDPNVRSIASLRDGRILLGSHDRGIVLLDSTLEPIGLLADTRGETQFRGDRVSALAESSDGSWWIGSDRGLFRRTPSSGALERFQLGPSRVRRLLANRDGGVWIGTESGLFHHRPGAVALEPVPSLDGPALDGDINALDLAPDGSLWIGGDQGLAYLAPGESAARWVPAPHPARGGNPDVLGLLVDGDAAVWFDTPSGLFRLTRGSNFAASVTAISADYGRSMRPFGANLLQDRSGRIWTQQHVLDPKRGRLLTLGSAEGIDIGSAWFRAYARSTDGRLFFGGSKGVLVIDPQRYEFPLYDAPLVITDLSIDDTPRPWNGSELISLLPQQRRLTVEFAALDYSAPIQLGYRYRVVGEDETWRETHAGYRVATLSNLEPGSYRLEIEASDRHGRTTGNRIELPIEVRPAWWQRGVFRATLAALAALLIYVLVRQRTHWLQARQIELERHVAARTAELAATSAVLAEKSAALERASLTDPLTGLANRRYFAAHIDADVALCRRRHVEALRTGAPLHNADLVFFLIDLDRFKQINDELGHADGDAVLVQMRQRLQSCFRDSDHLIRWGGEEFLVVSRDSDRRRAAELAARAVHAVAHLAFELTGGRRHHCTCSVGFAALPLQAEHPEQHGWSDAVALADFALHAAKQAGRNGWIGLELATKEPVNADALRSPPALIEAGKLRIHASSST